MAAMPTTECTIYRRQHNFVQLLQHPCRVQHQAGAETIVSGGVLFEKTHFYPGGTSGKTITQYFSFQSYDYWTRKLV